MAINLSDALEELGQFVFDVLQFLLINLHQIRSEVLFLFGQVDQLCQLIMIIHCLQLNLQITVIFYVIVCLRLSLFGRGLLSALLRRLKGKEAQYAPLLTTSYSQSSI